MSKIDSKIAEQIAKICIGAIANEKHIAILREFYGFTNVLNFSQTIQDLISLEQMDIFGISKEMQTILKHVNQLRMLPNITDIRKAFQKEYESLHKRIVVLVKIGQDSTNDIAKTITEISSKFDNNHDLIYQKIEGVGITVTYNGNIIEYTPSFIAKILRSA
jgi:hypothetical protein